MPDREHSGVAASPVDDYDSPWKEALESYFREAVGLWVPRLHEVIDWSVAPVFLDKELQAVVRSASDGHGRGRVLADQLVRVRLLAGSDAWLLIHVEVQGQLNGTAARRAMALRFFRYRYAIWVRHRRQMGAEPLIYSLCIVLRGQGTGPSLTYSDEYLGQGIQFTIPVVELERWRDQMAALEALAPKNPFAVIIMAQLQANRHRGADRLVPLLALARRLHADGYDVLQVRQVLRLLEWILRLPADLEDDYLQAVSALEQESKVTYVTIAERHGIRKGIEQGRAEGQAELLLRMVARRFGAADAATVQKIRTASSAQLEAWALNFVDAASLDDVFRD